MTDPKAPPIIFDEALLTMRRARAAKRGHSFLIERCLDDAAERLMDVNREFENVLILGSKDLESGLLSRLPTHKIKTITSYENPAQLPCETHFDLVFSCLRLQSENDLPGIVIQLRQKLKADGLFISAMFGGETLTELRQVFYQVDEASLGGISAHVYPMANYTQVATLLTRAGLNQPVIDTDKFTVSYSAFDTLIADLRDLGETNVLVKRRPKPFLRGYKAAIENTYKNLFAREDGKLKCSFEILWLTGWSPHKSQQKPLKPGSATISLKDGLNLAAEKSGQ